MTKPASIINHPNCPQMPEMAFYDPEKPDEWIDEQVKLADEYLKNQKLEAKAKAKEESRVEATRRQEQAPQAAAAAKPTPRIIPGWVEVFEIW